MTAIHFIQYIWSQRLPLNTDVNLVRVSRRALPMLGKLSLTEYVMQFQSILSKLLASKAWLQASAEQKFVVIIDIF